MPKCTLHVSGKNRLLEMLPDGDKQRVLANAERVAGKRGKLLFMANKPIAHAYFPLSGVISLVIPTGTGKHIEFGSVGNEGMAGLALLHRVDRGCGEAFFQVPGEALRMRADAFAQEIARRGALEGVLHRYAEAFLHLVAQSTACMSVHSVEQRLSRLILMSHDRVGSDTIELTQEFLAQMLGVTRGSVNEFAGMLQKDALISYKRGVIVVLDRKRLERRSCECYRRVSRDFQRLLC
jgi:CRP-like cAMP-binding protein